MNCPKSITSPRSYLYLEKFAYWKAGGGGSLWAEESQVAEAILFLNEEWTKEQNNGEAKK